MTDAAGPRVAREEAHAKVNLGLAVLTRRGDGYHEIETAMALVDVADTVEVSLAPLAGAADDRVGLTVTLAPDLPPVPLALGEENLAHRAATAYLRARRRAEPAAPPVLVSLTLSKRIPVAAGLGGGSADAGAVLRVLQRALPAQVDTAALAKALGSDVPFMLSGEAAALARGRGERLSRLSLPPLALVLVNPGFPVSTPEAYANLVGFTPRLRLDRALQRLAVGAEPGWPNALQPGVLRLAPELRGLLTAMRAAGLKGVLLSGSGPTCLGVAPDLERAEVAADGLRAQGPGWWVRSVATL